MVSIRSTGGNVVAFSVASLACSCAAHSLASTTCISGSPMSSSQTLALSSQRHAHSSSNFLILATVIVVVHSLPSRTSGGMPGVVCCWRSWTCSQNLFITSPIFNNCSSMVASMTRGTSGTCLYNFWTTAWVFCTIASASSFSFWDFVSLSSALSWVFKFLPFCLQAPSFVAGSYHTASVCGCFHPSI
jgi:hypothetical protein